MKNEIELLFVLNNMIDILDLLNTDRVKEAERKMKPYKEKNGYATCYGRTTDKI